MSLTVGIIGSIIGTCISMYMAQILHILDIPGKLKIHEEPIPRFGGLGIVVGTFLAFFVISALSGSGLGDYSGVMIAGLIMAFTGAVDDTFNLSPWHKLTGQLLSGCVFAFLCRERFMTDSSPWTMRASFAVVGIVVVVFMSNAFNLLDGMDGLAAGTSIIACGCLLFLTIAAGRSTLSILLSAHIGSCLGFMIYNIPPARTFMGDVGSLFLGYVVGVIALEVACFRPLSISAILGLILILAVPLTDTVFAIVRRIFSDEPVFSGDRCHSYDCIRKSLSGSDWKTLGIMWLITLVYGIVGILVHNSDTAVAVIVAATGMLVLIALALRIGCLPVFGTQKKSKRSIRV